MQKNLGHYYIYKFGVKENKKNWKKPNFKDDLISVEFTPNYNNIGIEIVNQSYEMVTVDWNRVRFEENDIVSNVLVWGSDFANKNEVLPVNILKPGQGMRTGIVPTELIDYAPKDSLANKNGYVVHQMYPDYDGLDEKESFAIMGLLGSELFKLKIPVIVRDQVVDYTFTFVPVEIERVGQSPLAKH
ncbi:MAG: hypothetical protein DI598_07760 [Pseudopedobacter saltans]|uniref:Uncharacterized protein n=1 Tax=Pseudopedobacter saltans TaxID=151895 RepID=A0A2W5F6G6_9SPHI|nr:MAG: hypothetical protein DI598_07760 [Pseudopedobacter saltans]